MIPAPPRDRLGRRDTLFAALVVATWGFNYVAIKIGVTEMPPLLMTSLRFALVAALVMPFARVGRDQWLPLLALSVAMGSLHFGILFVGMKGIDAATSAVALQTTVPFGVLIGAIAFRERVGLRRWSGVVLGFLGIVVIAGEPGDFDLVSLGLVLFAAFNWAAASALFKVFPPIPSLTYIGGTSLLAAPQTLIASLLLESGQIEALSRTSATGWIALVYTAVAASIVGHGLWYGLVKRHDLSLVVPFTLIAPVIGVLSSAAILGEALTREKMIGGLVTLVGVALIQIRPRRLRISL